MIQEPPNPIRGFLQTFINATIKKINNREASIRSQYLCAGLPLALYRRRDFYLSSMHKYHRLVNIFDVRSRVLYPGQTAHNQIGGFFTCPPSWALAICCCISADNSVKICRLCVNISSLFINPPRASARQLQYALLSGRKSTEIFQPP